MPLNDALVALQALSSLPAGCRIQTAFYARSDFKLCRLGSSSHTLCQSAPTVTMKIAPF